MSFEPCCWQAASPLDLRDVDGRLMVLVGRVLPVAMAAAVAAAAAQGAVAAAACDGYIASGAGAAGADGCYAVQHGTGNFVKDHNHTLYAQGDVWRIGQPGVHVAYVAKAGSHRGPPLAAASWQCGDGPAPGYPTGIHGSLCPGPTLTTNRHPPGPKPPPAPPGGHGSMYPVPTSPADKAVDCAVRASAYEFAQHIQSWGGRHLAVYDALELSTRCNRTRPMKAEAPHIRMPVVAAPGPLAAFHLNSLHGHDSAAGSSTAPFATIYRGVQACRTTTSSSTSGCALYLSDAAPFVLNQTLELTGADSFLTIVPEPAATSSPTITGSVPLTAPWLPHNITCGRNIWKTSVPSGVSSTAAVYVNGQRGVLARWPNVDDPATSQVPVGYAAAVDWLPPKHRPPATVVLQPSASRPTDQTFPHWTWGRAVPGSPPYFLPAEGYWMVPSPPGGHTFAVPAGLTYSAEVSAFSARVGSWSNASTGHVHAFQGTYWGNWIFEIASHNSSNRTLSENCDIYANFFRIFLLKMQKEWRISSEE